MFEEIIMKWGVMYGTMHFEVIRGKVNISDHFLYLFVSYPRSLNLYISVDITLDDNDTVELGNLETWGGSIQKTRYGIFSNKTGIAWF